MKFNFPPSYGLTVSLSYSSDEFYQKSINVFDKLKWKIIIDTPGVLKVQTKFNSSNFGEVFFVNYNDMENVKLKSKSKLLNIFDWGMNKSNVLVFLSYFPSTI